MRALRQIRNTGYIRARGWKPLGPAGERRYFFHPARSGVVLSISRPRPTGRSNFFFSVSLCRVRAGARRCRRRWVYFEGLGLGRG